MDECDCGRRWCGNNKFFFLFFTHIFNYPLILHWNQLNSRFFFSFFFSVLVACRTRLGLFVPQRRMHRKWYDSICFSLNRLQATVPVPIPSATIPQQMCMRQFWNSWFQRARIITSWGFNTITVKPSQERISTFHCQSPCCKLIYRITRTIAHNTTTCYQPRITSLSNTSSQTSAFVKRPKASRTCRATGEIGFSG